MNKYLGDVIILILIILFYGIIPIYCIIENLYKIITSTKIEKSAGKLLNKINDEKKYMTIYTAIILIISIFWMLKYKSIITLVFLFQGLFLFTTAILRKRFAYSNGIYENGLIIDGFIPWNNIHSYKIINNGTISFLMNTGNRFDVSAIRRIDEIIDQLNKNNVKNME